MRFFASDCVVFFCKEAQPYSRNVARISLYPAFKAKTARALALYRVAEVDLRTLINFVSKQFLRPLHRRHDAEKKLNTPWTIPKNETASTQKFTADWPIKFNECSGQGTISAQGQTSFILACIPLYCPLILLAFSYVYLRHFEIPTPFFEKKRSKVAARLAPVWLWMSMKVKNRSIGLPSKTLSDYDSELVNVWHVRGWTILTEK